MWSNNQSFRQSPCLNCTDRYVGCHANCERYKEAKQKYEEIRLERNKNVELQHAIASMKHKQYKEVSYHKRNK